jgi:hypothetical protein
VNIEKCLSGPETRKEPVCDRDRKKGIPRAPFGQAVLSIDRIPGCQDRIRQGCMNTVISTMSHKRQLQGRSRKCGGVWGPIMARSEVTQLDLAELPTFSVVDSWRKVFADTARSGLR